MMGTHRRTSVCVNRDGLALRVKAEPPRWNATRNVYGSASYARPEFAAAALSPKEQAPGTRDYAVRCAREASSARARTVRSLSLRVRLLRAPRMLAPSTPSVGFARSVNVTLLPSPDGEISMITRNSLANGMSSDR